MNCALCGSAGHASINCPSGDDRAFFGAPKASRHESFTALVENLRGASARVAIEGVAEFLSAEDEASRFSAVVIRHDQSVFRVSVMRGDREDIVSNNADLTDALFMALMSIEAEAAIPPPRDDIEPGPSVELDWMKPNARDT